MKNTLNKNKGFSLMELLVAIAILAVIMVAIGSFMTTTLHTQSRTSKEIEVQDEAQRIYYQMSDILMQATYIRVQPQDGKAYVYEKSAKSKNPDNMELKEIADIFTTGSNLSYVSEDYPNYQLSNVPDASPRKAIVSYKTGNIYDENDVIYPKAGSELDDDETAGYQLKSFRVLKGSQDKVRIGGDGKPETDGSGNKVYETDAKGNRVQEEVKYYVKPKYIYIEYSHADTVVDSTETRTQKIYKKKYTNFDVTTEVTTEVQVASKSTPKSSYVIFMYDEASGSLYMYRSEATATVPDATHRFATAVDKVKDKAKDYAADNKKLSVDGLVSSNVKSMYISADPDENSFDIDLDIENSRHAGYHYNMRQTVNFRNNSVLTMKRQEPLKWKGDNKTATPTTP